MNRKILGYVFFVLVVGLIAVGCGGGGGGGGSAVNPVAVPVNTGSVANLTGVVSFENVPLANAKVFLYPSASAYMGGIAQLSSVKANVVAQTLNNDGSYSTFTDGQGRYNFTSIPVGNYTLIAAKDQNHQFAKTNVILGAVTQQDAQLTPTGSVTGVVQIVNNNLTENVSGAIVYLDGTSYVAVSALDGKFTIANVPANQAFTLKVISSRGVPTTSPSVTITPGSTRNAGTILLSAPNVVTSTVSGQISIAGVASPDNRLAGHMVLLTTVNQPPLINLTDNTGAFAFIVKTAGSYRVTPIPEQYDSVPLNQDVNVILGQNVAL
ncbi:MAG: carboxypeptidase regulatory-like domain-containing protein, partial [Candidatus Rifleibacteriota bacterium]